VLHDRGGKATLGHVAEQIALSSELASDIGHLGCNIGAPAGLNSRLLSIHQIDNVLVFELFQVVGLVQQEHLGLLIVVL